MRGRASRGIDNPLEVRLALSLLLLLMGCRDESSPTARNAPLPTVENAPFRRADVPVPNVVLSTPVRSADPSIAAAQDYEFTAGRDHFKLDRAGRLTCRTVTAKPASCQLDLEEAFYVEELQFVRYGDDVLVLLYVLSDGLSGASRISQIYVPSCELAFTSALPGFNLGPAALEQSSLYVSVIGFVGKFDVETRNFDWSHGNLYRRYKLNAFGAPTVYRDRVVFPELTTFSHVPRDVTVDKASGAIRIVPQTPTMTAPKRAG